MSGRSSIPGGQRVEVVNLQQRHAVHAAPVLAFALQLKRRLHLGARAFNICLVDDDAIRRLNLAYRGRDKATDVLSFPWTETREQKPGRVLPRVKQGGITNFLGEVVISVQTARRNAEVEGHTLLNEIRWLVLHGVLHLLGYDHERDAGEMVALELSLRGQLGIGGPGDVENKVKSQNAKVKGQKVNPTRS